VARILVVDDEETDRVILKAALESGGHLVLFASDGTSALDVCRRESIDLVVTDLAMPGGGGLRLIRELREAGDPVQILAVSGRAREHLVLAEDYGADGTLFKPVQVDELLDTVRRLLPRSGGSGPRGPWTFD
jgi:two-component system phosphate regulon response regulator PhoB